MFSAQGYQNPDILPEDLWQNATWIERGSSSVNLTVHVGRIEALTGNTTGHVTFVVTTVNESGTFSLNASQTNDPSGLEWGVVYSPPADAVRGTYYYQVLVYNGSWSLMVTPTPRNGAFVVGNLDPDVKVTVSSTEIAVTKPLTVTFNASDPDDGVQDLDWEAGIFDENGSLVAENLNDPDIWVYTFPVGYAAEGIHQIRVNVTDGVNTVQQVASFYLYNPRVREESIQFDKLEQYRGDPIEIRVNLTSPLDVDLITSYNPQVTLKARLGETELHFPIPFQYDIGVFAKNFSFAHSDPAGVYTSWVEVKDSLGRVNRSAFYSLTVLNNPPTVTKVLVNGKETDQEFRLNKGQTLNCTIQGNDLEGLDSVGLNLIGGEGLRFNFTQDVEVGTSILVDTDILAAGLWMLEVYVVDDDGSSTYFDSVVVVYIRPNVLETYGAWVAFVVGAVVGACVGMALLWRRYVQAKESGRQTPVATPPSKTDERPRKKVETEVSKAKPEKPEGEKKAEKPESEPQRGTRKIRRKL